MTFQPGEEKAQRNHIPDVMDPSSSQWYSVTDRNQWAQNQIQEIHLNKRKIFFILGWWLNTDPGCRETVTFTSLEIFKMQEDMILL